MRHGPFPWPRGHVIGHQKARDTKQNVYRNFGMPNPEGYRKAMRVMKIAEKFKRPVFTFVDTVGAYPGLGAEERGQAEAIASNLREMARLQVPIITTITGEGGSGGALAIAVADRVLDDGELHLFGDLSRRPAPPSCGAMPRRKSWPPRRCASPPLTWQNSDALTASSPNPRAAPTSTTKPPPHCSDATLDKHFNELTRMPTQELVASRYDKFRNMAQFLRVE